MRCRPGKKRSKRPWKKGSSSTLPGAPSRIVHEDGRVTGIEFMRCISVFDAEGRFNPSFDEETRQLVEADTVIISIGQAPDISFLVEGQPAGEGLVGKPGGG